MHKLIAALAIALAAAAPAFADDHDDWAKGHYSEICLSIGKLWSGVVAAKQGGISKEAQESIAHRMDSFAHEVAMLSIIGQVYSTAIYDHYPPEMVEIMGRVSCEQHEAEQPKH